MSTNPHTSPGDVEIRDQAGRPLGRVPPSDPPVPAATDEDAFMEELRRRMETPAELIPVEEFLAYLDEVAKASRPVTPD
jgi:hypothetical protein